MEKILIDLSEQSELTFSAEELGIRCDKDLCSLLEAVEPLLEIVPGFDGKSFKFRSNSRVGVLELPGIRIQVRPKISESQFTTLLRYALGGQVRATDLQATSSVQWTRGFENALCRVLCDEIEEILRVGLSRKYVEREEPVGVLRGRPIWHLNFPWLGSKAREIHCRHHCLTYDNLDNRLLREGLARASIVVTGEMKTAALQYLSHLLHLVTSQEVNLPDFDLAIKNYSRLNEHYRVAHGLCKMFIFGLSPESFFSGGSQRVFGLVLDMAALFEMFVGKLLEDLLKPRGFSIKSQLPDRGALLDADDKVYSTVRPDFVVSRANRVVAVVDAKYKEYWLATTDGSRPQRKMANEDIYQLFFYQQRLQRLHGLPKPPLAIIAAPLPDEAERGINGSISERFKEVKWRAGTDISGHVNLLLIPMTQYLRLWEETRSIPEILPVSRLHEMFQGLL